MRLKYLTLFILCLNSAAWAVSNEAVMNYAPIVKLHPDEEFFPSSVEFFLQNVHLDGDYLITNQSLDGDSDWHIPFFTGQNLDITTPPVYAVRVPKPQFGPDVEDVHYFFFYPYNRGKSMFNTMFGNHVGDWERVRIRFAGETAQTIKLSYHDSDEIDFVPPPNTHDGSSPIVMSDTHPILYSAKGSHGSYVKPGKHDYSYFLSDETADGGKIWNTYENVVIIDYAPIGQYVGINSWMNFTGRWGNPEGSKEVFGYHILESGPYGPSEKDDVNPAAP